MGVNDERLPRKLSGCLFCDCAGAGSRSGHSGDRQDCVDVDKMIKPYFADGKGIEIYNADCLQVMKEMEDKSFSLVLTDPPYGMTACEWDIVVPFEDMWQELLRVGKDNAAFVFTASQPFTSALVMSNIKMFKYELLWIKEQGNQPQLCNIQPIKAHENILIFGNKKLKYNPQFTQGKPYNKKQPKEIIKAIHLGKTAFTGISKYQETKRYPLSYMQFNCERNGLHPTQKPVALMEYMIKTYSNKGDTIIDPFMGSGTSLVAAKMLGRKAVGIEISERYCKIAQDRLRQEVLSI